MTSDHPRVGVVHFQSLTRGNPGKAASAAVVFLDGSVVLEIANVTEQQTSNQADYLAMLLGLQGAIDLGCDIPLLLFDQLGDLNLLQPIQMSGEYRVRNDVMKKLHRSAHDVIQKSLFKASCSFEYLPKAQNGAYLMAYEAMSLDCNIYRRIAKKEGAVKPRSKSSDDSSGATDAAETSSSPGYVPLDDSRNTHSIKKDIVEGVDTKEYFIGIKTEIIENVLPNKTETPSQKAELVNIKTESNIEGNIKLEQLETSTSAVSMNAELPNIKSERIIEETRDVKSDLHPVNTSPATDSKTTLPNETSPKVPSLHFDFTPPTSHLEQELQDLAKELRYEKDAFLAVKKNEASAAPPANPTTSNISSHISKDQTNRSKLSDCERRKREGDLLRHRLKSSDKYLTLYGITKTDPPSDERAEITPDSPNKQNLSEVCFPPTPTELQKMPQTPQKEQTNKEHPSSAPLPVIDPVERLDEKIAKLSTEQRNLIALIDRGENCFITG
ncbi:hypothetical protein BDR26DRAFT_894547 [Obelidium mucronatum]|nr:hypothetical protein BDR26DRAFT_894547 [Obelidium mucronatum]